MAFFCGRLSFRILLLLASGVFFFFMPDILGGNPLALTLPYIGAVCFLVFVALFYRFPRDRSEKKIRNDIVIPPADPEKPVARDYHKDLEEKEHLLQFMFDVSTDGLWRFDAVTGKVKWSSRIPAICGIGKDLGDTFDVLKMRCSKGTGRISKGSFPRRSPKMNDISRKSASMTPKDARAFLFCAESRRRTKTSARWGRLRM